MMLYIHTPFCRSKCAYCDFYSTPRLSLTERWVDAAVAEWRERRPEGCVPETVYIGGGTPSALPLKLLERLVEGLELPEELREFTVEVNPDDVTPEGATGIHAVMSRHTRQPRVSMGVQSLDDVLLRFIGRRHTASGAVGAYGMLREAGFTNISLDLIYGLPGETLDSWERSLRGVLDLRPEHLSAYLLSYEPRTRLGVMLAQGKVEEASESLATEMYGILCRETRGAGYGHYEISNFALPGRRAIHNSGYWAGEEYIGIGPGAHSYSRGVRGSVPPNLTEYIRRGGRGLFEPEEESDENRYNDLIITSLRTADGLDPRRLDIFPERITDAFRDSVSPLLASGDIVLTDEGRYAIPESRWLTSDAIFLKLIIV